MYWEEIIELIKTHGDEPESTFPNPYNNSDYYEVYQYERGTVKTSYVHIDEFSEKIKDCFKKYLKYGLENIQIFSSLGASKGFGEHTDDGDVLIICLEGEIAYIIERMKKVILKAGDTIYIKEGLLHGGISSTVPRICLSCEVQKSIPKEDVTYYFGSRYRTKN
tara:strand:+ start:20 stop:511 length:492 start_codon:yes stop_codon:yes gene_type:complete